MPRKTKTAMVQFPFSNEEQVERVSEVSLWLIENFGKPGRTNSKSIWFAREHSSMVHEFVHRKDHKGVVFMQSKPKVVYNYRFYFRDHSVATATALRWL